ncbi:hypothetical protein SDC9_100550 [bioreactor metagenome]|uniref:Uncharacterized protein n=1 Tax=bioreactor metagenome TaxID=1076179 RepID=A0A645ANB7_9ZZZZ
MQAEYHYHDAAYTLQQQPVIVEYRAQRRRGRSHRHEYQREAGDEAKRIDDARALPVLRFRRKIHQVYGEHRQHAGRYEGQKSLQKEEGQLARHAIFLPLRPASTPRPSSCRPVSGR